MRPKKHRVTGSNDPCRDRSDQIINMTGAPSLLAGKVDWT